jgi:CHAT domain-containing protein
METHETWLGTSRDGATSDDRTEVGELADDDIVEIRLEGGMKLWQSVAATREDFATVDRSVSDQALLVPRVLHLGDAAASRDGSGLAVEGVKVIKSSFAGKAGEMTALAVARHIEGKLNLGFHRCVRQDTSDGPIIAFRSARSPAINATKQMLVLVHGTFSSTQGSFGDLADTPEGQSDLWSALETAFPAGIFALEHATVTQDPIQNAIELVEGLPRGAKLSLMSHSRGGLVAELVARAARYDPDTKQKITGDLYDDIDKAILKNDDEDTEPLEKLSKALSRKNITVERLIRIAGPIGGTTLASQRLDRSLSVALNALELIPALKTSVTYDLLKAFLMGFVKAKNDRLPGLEAMMPSSALVKLLNQADVMSAGSLYVIEGDNEGKGIFRKLRNFAVDLFFGSDNDFVVNTPSMSKGLPRATPPTVTPVVSAEITHFGYFRDDTSRSAILTAANSAAPIPIADNAGESLFAELTNTGINVSRARDASTLPVCFYLPGVMGTHLRHDQKWIWSNPFRMATGGLRRLRMPGTGVTPDEMMDRYYGELAQFLTRSHDVILFPYDWRQSVLTTGAVHLADQVRKALAETDQPIRFLAHSMGGLVVRAFIDAEPELWAEVKRRKGSRFVMLGTPNGGAFSMVHMMLGRAKAIRQLATLDVTHSQEELLGIVTTMPGPAQLLPSDSDGHYLKQSSWETLRQQDDGHWVVPPSDVFEASRKAHDLFGRQKLDPELVHYVAGLGKDPTPAGLKINQQAKGSDRVEFVGTFEGDGTVTWATGIPEGIAPYYMEAIHGDMARTTSAFPAIFDLLNKGYTSALSTEPLAASRNVPAGPVVLQDRDVDVFPDATDVLDSFLGADAPPMYQTDTKLQRTKVTMVHGDLRFSQHPVLVGHYMGDPINGAEGALDSCLSHNLSNVRNLGLYPGEIETCEVVLRMGRNPAGAVVAGLGRFGDLTPGRLRKTVNRTVMRYALTLRRRAMEEGKTYEEMEPICLTTLVIGHKGANMTIQQSVQTVLEAVADANIALKDTPIAHLEFVEIYEDTAFKAASALHSSSLNGPVAGLFDFDRRIKSGDGALLRMDFGLESGTWQRISVSRAKGVDGKGNPDQLDFTVISDGAKAEFKKTAVQTDVINQLLAESRKTTATDRSLGQLLFQLMIPIELKAFAQNDQNIQLILDENTAAIPWELMEDSVSVFGDGLYQSTGEEDFRPLVVRTPVVRQLVSPGATVPRARFNKVLVVGDPKSSLPILRGAEREAKRVADQISTRGIYEVNPLIRPENGLTVLKEVMLTQYKIMHFAAHGVYEEKGDHVKAGLVLSDGVSLTSAELRNMEYVPEFVFLNCCHTGRIEENTGPIAADLSRTLIDKGVRAVIAAGWAVDDTAADLFAEEFYDSMLNGWAFGDAVHHARMEVFKRHPDTNTWGAYQCYGDPEYRFEEPKNGASHGSGAKTYYSSDHARKAAINIARDVGSGHRRRADLVAELDALMEGADPAWEGDARWCEAVARAYAKLDVFAPAIKLLETARVNYRATLTVDAIELLEHLKVRAATFAWTQAVHTANAAEGNAKQAADALVAERVEAQRDIVSAALRCLKDLDELLGSKKAPALSERRESLKGTVCKRMVLTRASKSSQDNALKEMLGYYKSAKDLAAAGDPNRLKPHPTFNWLSGHVVLGSKDADGQPYEAVFAQMLAQNTVVENTSPGFWTAALPAEIDILRGMLAQPTERDAIFKRFEDVFRFAWTRGGAFGQARSIREHVHFLKTMSRNTGQRIWMTRVQTFLDDLTWPYRNDHKDEF